VKRFTTAPRGEVDGAVLDDGTVIHWPPHLRDRFTGIIDKGDRIKVSGRAKTTPAGETRLEVRTVTNLGTGKAAENEGPRPPAGRGEKPGHGKGGELERRLQTLENQVDELRKEVARLRREK
jgi:hypothetical protein